MHAATRGALSVAAATPSVKHEPLLPRATSVGSGNAPMRVVLRLSTPQRAQSSLGSAVRMLGRTDLQRAGAFSSHLV